MKKMFVIVVMMAGVIWIMQGSVYGQVSPDWSSMNNIITSIGISRDDLDQIKDQIDKRSQPVVKNVTISPENPSGNDPVSIIATIVTPHKANGEEVYEAYINYSTDNGKTMARIAMEKETQYGNTWKGVIPGQPSGTNVIFGIQAASAFDETYVETICEIDDILKNVDQDVTEDCKDSRNFEYCAAQIPEGCMFPMSVSLNKLDADSEDLNRIPYPLYIKTTRAGFSEDKLFLELNLKDQVSPGSFPPPDIYIYPNYS